MKKRQPPQILTKPVMLPSLYGGIDREMILAQPPSVRPIGYKPHQGPREIMRRRKRQAQSAAPPG